MEIQIQKVINEIKQKPIGIRNSQKLIQIISIVSNQPKISKDIIEISKKAINYEDIQLFISFLEQKFHATHGDLDVQALINQKIISAKKTLSTFSNIQSGAAYLNLIFQTNRHSKQKDFQIKAIQRNKQFESLIKQIIFEYSIENTHTLLQMIVGDAEEIKLEAENKGVSSSQADLERNQYNLLRSNSQTPASQSFFQNSLKMQQQDQHSNRKIQSSLNDFMFRKQDRQVLVILFKAKIDKIYLCLSAQTKKPVQFANNKTGNLQFSSFLLVLKDGENLLQNLLLSIQCKQTVYLIGSRKVQKKILLKDKIQWNYEKSVCFLYDDQNKSQYIIQLSALIKSTKDIWNMKKTHQQIRLWWETIQRQFHFIISKYQLTLDQSFDQILKEIIPALDKGAIQYNKYLLWLLTRISSKIFWKTLSFGNQLLKIEEKNIEQMKINENLGDLRSIDLIYLRVLYYGKQKRQKTQKLLIMNFSNQPKEIIKQMLSLCSQREFQAYKDIIVQEFITNSEVTLKEFVKYYFKLQKPLIVRQSTKKNITQQSDQLFRILLNLKNKCIKLGKGRQVGLIQASQYEESMLEVFQRQQIHHGMNNNVFRFQGEGLVKYIIQSKAIEIYQPNLCNILLKIARINQFKINKIPNIYPALFIPPFNVFQPFLKYLFSDKRQQMVLYIQRQNKKGNLKNIITFIVEYFKEDEQLKGIIQEKINKSLELQAEDRIQLNLLINAQNILSIKETLFFIIDDQIISNLYRTNSQEKITLANHSVMDKITISYAVLKNINSSELRFNCFREQAGSTYLNTKSTAINPNVTIALIKRKKLTDAQYSSVILSALDIIQKLQSQNKLQRVWIYELSKQIQKVPFQQFAECIRQRIKQSERVTMKSITSLLIVASSLSSDKVIDLIENKDIWNGWRAEQRPYRMDILEQYLEQQKKLSVNMLFWILKSYLNKQDENTSQISSLASIQAVSNKYQEVMNLIKNESSKKEIILYVFKNLSQNVLKISKLLKEINQGDAFINEIQKNKLFSIHDLRNIMLFMMPNSSSTESEIKQVMGFMDRLIQKSQSEQSNDHSVEIPSAHQNIRSIFFTRMLRYNQQSPEVFVFNKLDNFQNMYSKLKSIKHRQTYLFINNQIKQIAIYFSKFMKTNFDEIVKLIFQNPLQQEINTLKTYLDSTQLSNIHINAFIQLIILTKDSKKAQQFFKSQLKRIQSLKLNSFNLIQFIQNIHQKAFEQDKKRIQDIFDMLLEKIVIDKQSIDQFLAVSKMLVIDHLFLPFIKKICQSYYEIYQKTAKSQHKFHQNLLLLYKENQEQQKIQVILDTYLQILKDNNKLNDTNLEEKIINFWNAIVNDPKSLQLIKSCQKKSIQQIQKKIEEKLQRNQVTIGEIKKIRINQKKIKSKFPNIFKIISEKYKKMEELETDLSKINTLTQMFPALQKQRDKIKNIMSRKEEIYLVEILQFMESFQQFREISIDVQSFRRIQLWGKREIKSKEDLKKQWNNCRQILMSLTGTIEQMSFAQYQSIFYKLSDECIDHNLKTQKDLSKKIKLYNKEINQFQSNIDTWMSYQYFKFQVVKQDLTKKELQYSDFIVNFQKQKKGEKSEHTVCQIIESMRSMMNYMLKTINYKSQSQQILTIIKTTFQCQSLFQKIEESSLDEHKLNSLKQFSNQMQNSIIRPQSVMKLRNVSRYWKNVYNSKKISQAFEYIHKTISLKVNLKECIMDSKGIEIILFQKLLEANDRTNYFRIEIQALLKCSCLKLIMVDDKIDVQVLIKDERFSNKSLDFRRLSSLKQKSLLYDFSLLEGKQQNSLDPLTIYCQLFKQIQSIRRISNQLSGYAYKPSKIISSIQIGNSNLQIIINKKQQLQSLKKEWIASIRQICSKSYLFTHFVGQKLNSFIENLKKFVYQPSMMHIINLSREQFYVQIIKVEIYRILADSSENIIDNYRKISHFFIKQEERMQQEQYQSNSIVLITSKSSQFNQHIINQNYGQLPRYNQIFYCHQHSSELQIEFFLFRSLIDFSNRYFIVGVTKLNENLKSSLCKMISRLKEQRKAQFKRSNLVFIDDKQSGNIVYAYLSRPKRFSIKKVLASTVSQERIEQLQKILAKNIKNVELVTSARAGLGKTYYVEQKIGNKQLVNHFPIAGTIDVKNLVLRLKKLSFAKGEALLIKLGHVINKHLLQIFLESIILHRGFFAQQYFYLPEQTKIFIQLQNIHQPQLLNGQRISKQYNILHFLQLNCLEHHIDCFNPSLINFDGACLQDLFVYYYFDLLQTNQVNMVNTQFLQFKPDLAPSNQKKIELIRKYYLNQTNLNLVSFINYSNLMKMLFSIIQTFSNNQFLLPYLLNNEPIFKNYRQQFLAVCIKNAICLMQQLQSSHSFREVEERPRNFREIKQDMPLIILPDFTRQAFKFVTLNNSRVPYQIKLFNAIQNRQINNIIEPSAQNLQTFNEICQKNSISEKKDDSLKKQIFQILQSISRDTKYKEVLNVDQLAPQTNYVLTLDNFCKMCFIVMRERCGIPCIIQGQSGVGKTALIDYLSKRVFKNQLLILNVHAGIHQIQLSQFVNKIKISAQKIQQSNQLFKLQYQSDSFQKRLWVFLDQYNTCDEYGYIKQMVLEHRFMGQKLPNCIQFLAACNPYRYYETKDYIQTGLRRNRYGRQQRQNQLAFKVNHPPFSMIQLAWNYHQLTKQQNQCYVMSILNGKKSGDDLKEKLAHTVVKIHENIKERVQISAVSLRDVERVKELYQWFRGYLKKVKNERQAWQLSSAVLALIFCYALRFHKQSTRKYIFQLIERYMGLGPNTCQQIFEKQQNIFAKSILDSKKLKRDKIALNKALKENIFVTFVCVMNKIPVLIIGNPGSSKSLAVNYLASALTGASSQAAICKQYPQINMIYFQGSESSTSAGVQEVFQRAEQYHSQNYINCIYFDEIGLAEMSVHNPLKVLHSWLQIHGKRIPSFIGISNHQLDASKMSRFLILNRTQPDLQDLESTAQGIFLQYESDSKQLDNHQKTLNQIASYYHKFITENSFENFFGLRDYYNYVKYICKGIMKETKSQQRQIGFSQKQISYNILKHIERAIEINFDGREDSVKRFKSFLPQIMDQATSLFDPLQLINQNLQDNTSRCLLLIVEGDTLMPYIKNALDQANEKKSVAYYGSAFAEDQKSEEYNYQITNKIISYMAKGNTILFKDPNSSIQSSLYQLFNKAYTEFGENKMCRIAVGANSNLQCSVHEDFRAIIVIQSRKVAALNPPFLNRFQKHRLQLESLLQNRHQQILKRIKQWINKITSFCQNGMLKRQNIILNSSQRSLLTLILKHKDLDNEDAISQIKLDLLKNRTTDFLISLISQKSQNSQSLLRQLEELCMNINPYDCRKQDLIIYTYDQYIHLQDSQAQFLSGSFLIHLLEISSERELKQNLKLGFENEKFNKITIIVDYFKSYQFIQQLLYLAKQIKEQSKINKKQIVFICQLHRFNLVIPKEDINLSTVNISYLHKYQQYFCQDFSTKITQGFGGSQLTFFSLLYKINCFQIDILKQIHTEACSCININLEDEEMNSEQYYQILNELGLNKIYWQELNKFMEPILSVKLRGQDYSIFHNNTHQLISCSNIYQIIKIIIKSLSKKLILQFLKIIVPNNNFLRLFFDGIQLYSESEQRIRQIYKQEMEEILKYQSEKLRQSIHDNISQNEQQVDLTIIKNDCNLNLKRIFKEINNQLYKLKNQGIIPQEIEKIEEFSYFKNIFESIMKRYPSFEKILNQETLRSDIISQLLCFMKESNIQRKALIWLTSYFQTQCRFQTIEYLLYLFLSSQENQLIPIIQLASIITRHTQSHIQILHSPLNFCNNNLNDGLKNVGRAILSFAYELSRLSNFPQFTGTEGFMEYIKSLGENESVETLENLLQFQVNNQYYQILTLIHFCEKDQNGQQLFQKFIQLSTHQSIYNNILKFCQNFKSQGRNNLEIETFLTYSFFQYWISHIINTSSSFNAQECILKFANMCNNSIEFANRSHTFFKSVFQLSDNNSQEKSLKQRLNIVLEEISAKNQLNDEVSKYLNNSNNFSLSLFTYFYRVIQQILSGDKKEIVLSNSQIFSKYFCEATTEPTIKNYFKLAFIKKYLSIYILSIANTSNTYQEIEQALNQMSFIKQFIFTYLNNSLRKIFNHNQIKERFIDIHRCDWIQDKSPQIVGRLKLLQRFFVDTQSIISDQNQSYSESLLGHLKINKELPKHQLLTFLLKHYNKGYGKFLNNISPILLFLSKLRRMINLRMTRYELEKQTIQQWIIAKARVNPQEAKQLKIELQKFLKCLERIQSPLQLKDTSPLSYFVLQHRDSQRSNLAMCIKQLTDQYNKICVQYLQIIRQTYPKSSILRNKSNRINPFSLKSSTPLLALPLQEELQARAVKYSYYSLQEQPCQMHFCIEQIQLSLLQNMKNFYLLIQQPKQWLTVKLVGEDISLLQSFRKFKLKSLKQLNMLDIIESSFVSQKINDRDNYIKYSHKILRQIELLMRLLKRTSNIPQHSIGVEVAGHQNLQKNIKQLLNRPFSQVSCQGILSLYQFIQYRTFQNIQIMLEQQFRSGNAEIRKTKQSIEIIIKKLKQNEKQSRTPTYEQFKRALYRLIGRKVISSKVNPKDLLSKYLCDDLECWDYNLDQKSIKWIKEEFRANLDIELAYLGRIIKEIPYNQVKQLIPDEPNTKTVKKKPNFKKI